MEKHNWSQLATRLVVKYAEYFTLLGRGLLCGAAALGLPLFRQAGTAAESVEDHSLVLQALLRCWETYRMRPSTSIS